LPLSDDTMIFELAPPESFLGKTMAELQLRSQYNVMVIAVKDLLTDRVVTLPPANFVIKDGQALVLVGREADIEKLR
jgi:trk system potassium uptake protein TrkA